MVRMEKGSEFSQEADEPAEHDTPVPFANQQQNVSSPIANGSHDMSYQRHSSAEYNEASDHMRNTYVADNTSHPQEISQIY